MKINTLILLLALSNSVFAGKIQRSIGAIVPETSSITDDTIYCDFDTISLTFAEYLTTSFDVDPNPDKTGINASKSVGKVVSSKELEEYVYTILPSGIDFSENNVIKLKVFSADTGNVVIKLIDNIWGYWNLEKSIAYTTPNQWQELSFDLYGPFIEDSDYNNLMLHFGNNDTTENIAWYFDDLSGPMLKPLDQAVTFKVNMKQQIFLENFDPSKSLLDLSGSFNNWGSSPMTDIDNDHIYEVTIDSLYTRETLYFKFRMNGVWDGTEEFFGGSNRRLSAHEGSDAMVYWYNDEAEIFPKASFEINTSEVKALNTITFTNTTLGNSDSIKWSFEGGTPAFSSDDIVKIAYEKLGFYDVMLTAYYDTIVDSLRLSDCIYITQDNCYCIPDTSENSVSEPTVLNLSVDQAPELTVSVGEDTELNSGEFTQLGSDSIVSGGNPDYIYLWYPSNGLDNNTVAQPTASPMQTTTYVLTVTDAMGCSSSDEVMVTVIEENNTIGIAADHEIDNFELFPNPNNGQFTIDFGKAVSHTYLSLEIFDISGAKLWTQGLESAQHENGFSIDVSFLEKGMYLLLIGDETSKISKKLMID